MTAKVIAAKKFPFNYVPQQIGTEFILDAECIGKSFPFNCVPQQIGTSMDVNGSTVNKGSFHSTVFPNK